MLLASSLDNPAVAYASPEGSDVRVTRLFTPPSPTAPGPQSYWVETFTPGATLRAHFHPIDQFQLFTGGNGRVGSTPARRYLLHYSDADTPYGPLVAGSEGIHYLTLRMGHDPVPGGCPMPESRPLRRRLGGRHIMAPLEALPADGAATTLIAPHADGLAAAVLSAAAGGAVTLPAPAPGGQHAVVLAGALEHAGRAHPFPSSLVGRPGDPPLDLVGGPAGLAVLVCQFPEPEREGRRRGA